MALVLGLGNPGERYARTRHNAGFLVVELLAERWKARRGEATAEYRSWSAEVGGRRVDLVEPLTYMNLSGTALLGWAKGSPIDPGELLVVADDIYLPVGMIRLRARGSSGGHRGLTDVEAALATTDYARLRVGVGTAAAEQLREHVLAEPDADEGKAFDEGIVRAADAVECWIGEGILAAMNRFNRKVGKEVPET